MIGRKFLCLSLLAAACVGPAAGPFDAPRSSDVGSVTARNAMGDALGRDCLQVSGAADTAEDRAARRNRLVAAHLIAIDAAYYEYERGLLDHTRRLGLGSLLSRSRHAGPVDNEPSRALSASATTRPSGINREQQRHGLVTLLQTQMRASRAEQRNLMTRRLELPYDEWNSCLALADALAYEQAGTLNNALGALQALAESALRAQEASR